MEPMTEAAEKVSSSETPARVAKPRLRWYQFSLRSLLIFVTLCAIACSWLATWMQRQRRQFEAVKAFDNKKITDGSPAFGPFFCFSCFNQQSINTIIQYNQTWAGYVIRDISLANITTLAYSSGDIGWGEAADIDIYKLENINYLPHLETLGIQGDFPDEGLKFIENMKQLQNLYLSSSSVTDAGLCRLEHLRNLKEMKIRFPKVTQQGIEKLRRALPNCKIESYKMDEPSMFYGKENYSGPEMGTPVKN
jgi:hypothetical protein